MKEVSKMIEHHEDSKKCLAEFMIRKDNSLLFMAIFDIDTEQKNTSVTIGLSMERGAKENRNWREEVSKNLDYYLDTKEGRNELVEMIKDETMRLLQQMKGRQRVKEFIWLSRFCLNCSYFVEGKRGFMKCMRLDARIVKPFYGKPLWAFIMTANGEESSIVDIDWHSKSFDVSEILVEEAIKRINNGYPYPCFEYRL